MIRDDRILSATRWTALVVFLILVPAVVVLWGAPGHTADLWAWTIKAPLTAAFLGSGYAAGAYFFWCTFRAERWHPSSAGVLGASVFAGFMLIATVIHYDVFNHGHGPAIAAIAFYGWTIVYVISPFAVFGLWLRNQRTDSGLPAPRDAEVPRGALLAARAFAAGALAGGLVFFLVPQVAIDIWPWPLTPLTARVLASFTIQVGVGAAMLSRDARWSAWRLIVQTFFVAVAILLVAAVRLAGGFETGNVMTWLYLGGLVGTAGALALLYRRMERAAPLPLTRRPRFRRHAAEGVIGSRPAPRGARPPRDG